MKRVSDRKEAEDDTRGFEETGRKRGASRPGYPIDEDPDTWQVEFDEEEQPL